MQCFMEFSLRKVGDSKPLWVQATGLVSRGVTAMIDHVVFAHSREANQAYRCLFQ